MKTLTKEISGWGRYPRQKCNLIRPEKYRDLHCTTPLCIARGQGRSYGDASLNENHTVILTERLNRFLDFDKTKGVLTAEAGLSLADIIDVIVPAGWFLPVTPGTQYATLGGCVAADVHGKNHHRDGSFGMHVLAFELITADNKKILCTPKDNAELFWATIGGMGLTGIIGTVVLKLMPITSQHMIVRHHAATDLEQAFSYLTDSAYDDHYTVAWIDCLASDQKLGRSIVMTAHHAQLQEVTTGNVKPIKHKQKRFPIDLPGWVLNSYSINLFNEYYYKSQAKKAGPYISDIPSYFYPLDKILDWNKLYGKNGFVQYQCVLPSNASFAGIKNLLEKLSAKRASSFLAVLKRFGESSNGLLSFPMPGYTLALDIPFKGKQTLNLLNALDEIVLSHQGRVYLAKDARLSPAHFRQMYPKFTEWFAIKKNIDPKNIFSSSLSRRLSIGTTNES